MDIPLILYIFVCITVSFIIKGLVGFGDPLLYTPLLSVFLPNSTITPGMLPVSLVLNARVVWKNRAHFSPQLVLPIAAFVMLGIIPGTVLVPTVGKKIENGVMRIRQKDEKWGSLFMTALFLGMISAFLGMVFATVSEGLRGWIPCFVMIASALIMCVCAVFVKVLKWKWMEDYALPISMLGGMALSIPITDLINAIA